MIDAGWSAPLSVVSGAPVTVNAADVPSMRRHRRGRLRPQWPEANGPDPEAYDLRIAWSADGGHSWSPPLTPHDDATKTQHGFASIVGESDGGFSVFWIDGRNGGVGLLAEMDLRSATYDGAGR